MGCLLQTVSKCLLSETKLDNKNQASLDLEFNSRDFPDSPVIKTSPFNAEDMGSIPDQGTKIPHALRPKNQNIR